MDGSFFDPITGVHIHATYVLSEGMGIFVEYDQENKLCEKSVLTDWSSAPYLRYYYNLEPISSATSKRRLTVTVPNYELPKYSKSIRGAHLALKPGDFFHLKVDSISSEPTMCPRMNFEINADLSNEFLNFTANLPANDSSVGSEDEGNNSKTTPLYNEPLTLSQFRRIAKNINHTYEYPLQQVPASALGKKYLIRLRYNSAGNTIYKSFMLYITADGKLPKKIDHAISIQY